MLQLNKEQQKAIRHFRGPCCVIGTPGSGKTRVITERVKFLVQECNIKPENILVITFTKAAAIEMKRRYSDMIGDDNAGRVQFGTFHAIFFTILKIAYNYTADNIIHDDVKRNILKEITSELDIEVNDENEFLNDIASEISHVKEERIDLEHYYSMCCPDDAFKKTFKKYQNELAKRRLIDFDDMLVYCYELLKERPDILKMWHKQYPYILIDEFQDINKIQYDVIRLLGRPENNIFIVGDDDQSIYGFRGARPDIMQHFVKEYNAVKHTLGINYRCSGAIVNMADRLVSNNKNRILKRLKAFKPYGENVEVKEFEKITDENVEVCNSILNYRNQGILYSDIAVLFRTNTQARALSSKFMEYNIPFIMKERIPNIYEHWLARDIIAYIRAALGDRERATFLRIINRPKRYVHRNAFSEQYVDLEELKKFYEDKYWMIERLEQFEIDLKMLSKLKPFSAVDFIRRSIGYDDYIREYAGYRGIRVDDMMNILDELAEDAKVHNSFGEWFDYIERYGEELKEQAGKSRAMQNGTKQEDDAVVILTMHGAKGLEYECVFIPDVNEGIIPHNKAVLDADVEEERRMFYVAMTRAKSHLHIYYVKERFNKEADMSRFINEVVDNINKKKLRKKSVF